MYKEQILCKKSAKKTDTGDSKAEAQNEVPKSNPFNQDRA